MISIRWLAQEFGRRLGKKPQFTGAEAETGWVVNSSRAAALMGYPRVPLVRMVDWVADWVANGRGSLGKPTHFEARDGTF